MSQADFNHFTYLGPEQLRKLARIIYYQETEAIKNIQFEYEAKLAKYLRDCKACYESAIRLLDSGSKLEPWFNNDDNDRASIAHDIYGYVVNATNHALQFVRNFRVRMDYVNKIEKHVDGLRAELDDDLTNMEELARKASTFRNDMLEIARGSQSPASRQYSRWIKETGKSFEELVQKYQTDLGYGGLLFEELEDVVKIRVFGKIIFASGRANINVTAYSKMFGAAGIAVLIFATGFMVWDIFSADNPLQTAVRDAVITAASIGGAMIGELVGVALAAMVTANPLLILMAGITASIAGAFLIGEFATWLIDVVFGSGGRASLSTMGHRCYVAHLPDGSVLARRIAHQQS
ncbi:hypothetical protein ACFX15_023941 [Malus domestica]|uniref:uncharacterized protein LOC126609572 n=1 Tax=Malus sylvestris TaxID=3752 RepID=UPI0010AA6ADB|nr:uncharacterized protein LOC103411086 [Malus domestica]XP_050133373.1 uncharacterized protein LOC126609572 [Malus sylvestris]